MGRTNYDALKARGQEGLLDVLSHAGLRVIWRSNNSGCKGVCDRVEYQDLSIPEPGAVHCSTDECYDERLLVDFPDIIGKTTNDTVLVLHQNEPPRLSWRPVSVSQAGMARLLSCL